MHALNPGKVLHGRYRIMRPIGKGGMGAVYEATDSRLHNAVAVKQMTASGHDDAFEREARLLAALRHPGLPVVIDYFSEGGDRFLVMQYIEGEDLAHVVRRCEACDEEDVVSWGIAILDVLIYLHENRPAIVHRDIKPANIKLTPRGDVVLLDFGLAKGRLQSQTSVDDFRSVYGFTPGYAPIEQVEWSGSDVRSDLYGLGATLFHLVTGVPPASSRARASALSESRPDPLRPATEVRSNITGAFSRVLTRALDMDPARRFASAHEMRNALMNHTGARRLPKPFPECADQRRVDAAMPSQAQVGSPVDLLVQVRFEGSPLLGLEDWPTKRLPERIEQQSETLHLHYPRDPETGRQLPARLRINVVAPAFVIDGRSEHLIEVPPDQYSKRLVFLLTPQRAGLCRLNVEVYAVDALYLGTIPVEAEAVPAAVANPVFRVANLVLGLFTRERDTTVTAIEPAPERTVSPDREDVFSSHSFPEAEAVLSVPRLEERLESALPVEESISAGTRARGRRFRWISVAPPLIVLIGVVFASLYSMSMWRAPSPSDQAALPPSATETPPGVPPPSTPAAPVADTAKLREEIETKLHRAETAMKEGRLEFARHEVESVLAKESANPRARELQQQIVAAVSERALPPPSTATPSPPVAIEPPPPAPKPVQPPPAASDPQSAVSQLLAEYEAAYESLDVERMRRIIPAFTRFPSDLVSTDLTISNVRVTVAADGQSATVSITVQFRNKFSRAVPSGLTETVRSNLVWRVERTLAGWIIK